MAYFTPCSLVPRRRLQGVYEFLASNRGLFDRLPAGTHDAYVTICGTVSHLKSRRATSFFIEVFHHIEKLNGHPMQWNILRGARLIAASNWMMTAPYFTGAQAIPQDEHYLYLWTVSALRLANGDIDAAVTFLSRTPEALKTFGPDATLAWGAQALAAAGNGGGLSGAIKAYLEESALDRCATPLNHWEFLLNQARRVSSVSPRAAEAFIRMGSRACMILNDRETEEWVTQGLNDYFTEEELIGYFSGSLSQAMLKRDGLASGVKLEERANTLSLICEAFLGTPVKIRSNKSLAGVKGFTGGAATDGRTVYLPDMAPDFHLLKLMALHQAGLLFWDEWRKPSMRRSFDPFKIHMRIDRLLVERLPALQPQMRRAVDMELPPEYPHNCPDFRTALPWWGDLLPDLMRETSDTIDRIMLKVEERADLPPEMIKTLISYMMAEGSRDHKELWSRVKEIIDSVEFLSPDAEDLEEPFRTFFYKEWDVNLSDYKVDWCLVRQRFARDDPNTFVRDVRERVHGLVNLIRRQFIRLKPDAFKKYRAQEFGDDLDLDALIPAYVEMLAGAHLSDSVYIRRDKRQRDVAVLFLIDMSASTEERVKGRRVIDIQKEAMALMAEALESIGDPFAVYGFTSEGRFRVDLFVVKDFGEPYNERVQYRLGSLEPRELTRLGAVIRHGVYKLENVQALIKLMVILTDGRPYDLEYGTLNYAIADTKKSLQEARQRRIHPFIITSDKKGSDYMKWICPQTQSIIVPRVEHLPVALPALYKRLTT